jgi:DNA replication licensing factor MCM4
MVTDTYKRLKLLKTQIFNFLKNYPKENMLMKYTERIIECTATQAYKFDLDCKDLFDFDPKLYTFLIDYPLEFIPVVDSTVYDIARASYQEKLEQNPPIFTRPYNLKIIHPIRELEPNDIEHLVSIRGLICHIAPIYPDLKFSSFVCQICGTETRNFSHQGVVKRPSKCKKCRLSFTSKLIHNKCWFANKQLLKLQETTDVMPEGETPHTTTIYASDDLVDRFRTGDRVEVVGIYRAIPFRVKGQTQNIKTAYKTYIDLVNVNLLDKNSLYNRNHFNKLDERCKESELRALSQSDDMYERLMQSIAPSVFGHFDVKKGVLCQLFGGVAKHLDGGRIRGDVNILLMGNPGVGKSKILEFVHKISPRGIYVSGRGSSAVGLTACVRVDMNSNMTILEPGALVLSDSGLCCIDEFDTMSESSRSVLHEVIEQQSISIAKGGVVCNLNARTSVLASANPIGGRYNSDMTVLDNIQLPTSLLSRFDLVYLMLDKPNDIIDKELARHIISSFWRDPPPNIQNNIDTVTLRDYISYSKSVCFPVISDYASFILVKGYLYGRSTDANSFDSTPRYLESLIRISESLARMKLSQTITREHALEALRLSNSTTYEVVLRSDNYIDKLYSSNKSSLNKKTEPLKKLILNLLMLAPHHSVNFIDLWNMLELRSKSVITWTSLDEIVYSLEKSGQLHRTENIITLGSR